MGRVEHPVDRDGQLDGAEVRPEMTTCARHRVNKKVADLRRQRGKIVDCQSLQIVRIANGRQKRHRHFLSVHFLPLFEGIGPGRRSVYAGQRISRGRGLDM